jgi:probable DNA repair protein
MAPDYLQLLRDGVTLVTPTRRLAGLVADRYGARMAVDTQGTWEAPPVLPLGAWLAQIHDRLGETGGVAIPGILLSADQELAIWEQSVDQADTTASLSLAALARLAADASATRVFWELPAAQLDAFRARTEVRAFLRWCERFDRRCRELGAIGHARFAAELAQVETAILATVPPFRLFGFTRVSPLLQQLAQRCPAGGVVALEHREGVAGAVATRAFDNAEMEIRAAMQWAHAEKSANPAATVSVAVAGSRRIDPLSRAHLVRAFNGVQGGEPELALDCPQATPLADAPIIAAALLLLDPRRERPWQDFSRILLSPYIGGANDERAARARLDRELRRNGDIETTWRDVVGFALRADIACPDLAARTEAVLRAAQLPRGRSRRHDWMAYAEGVLAAAGWPGECSLTPAEQAALLEWGRVMDSVAALDAVAAPCTWPEAFAKWRALLRQRPQTANAPLNAVHVITPDEAAFTRPDRVWVIGLNDHAWPPPTETNPLLPLTLLREHGVPGTDPGDDLRAAEAVLDTLGGDPGGVMFSFSLNERDTPRRPFAGLDTAGLVAASPDPWPRRELTFELLDDDAAPPPPLAEPLRGGVTLLADQAACPFRALARYRLHATAPEDPTPGLNALQRGTLVHAVMATFWEAMRTSARLAAAADQDVEALLERAAATAVSRAQRRYRLPAAYWALEQRRLADLAREWLACERDRGDFDVVACEQAGSVQLGEMTLNTRIDRIDRLAHGGLVIIDYKTGTVSSRDWEPPRPDQPQLPVYALAASAGPVAGIAYAQVRTGDCRIVDFPSRCTGRSAGDDGAEQWHRRTEEWSAELAGLAAEFTAGYARVAPKRAAATCRYCDLQALCRIDETTGGRDDPAETVDD